jgi:hypothetical protein
MMNETDYGLREVKSPSALVIAPGWPGSASHQVGAALSEVATSYNNGSTPSTKQLSTLWNASGDEGPAAPGFERGEDYRHWSPLSQPYAPADVLLQYLRERWQIQESVLVEVSRCISYQCTEMYNFILIRGGERITMPVLANPVVLRLTRELGLILIRVHTASENQYSHGVEDD